MRTQPKRAHDWQNTGHTGREPSGRAASRGGDPRPNWVANNANQAANAFRRQVVIVVRSLSDFLRQSTRYPVPVPGGIGVDDRRQGLSFGDLPAKWKANEPVPVLEPYRFAATVPQLMISRHIRDGAGRIAVQFNPHLAELMVSPPKSCLTQYEALAQGAATLDGPTSAGSVVGDAIFSEKLSYAVDVVFVDALTEARQQIGDVLTFDQLLHGSPFPLPGALSADSSQLWEKTDMKDAVARKHADATTERRKRALG